MKDRLSGEHIVTSGKAAFYASIYPVLISAAHDCGWALGLHGSLANDMDLMAMPWTETATPASQMIASLSACFVDSPYSAEHIVPHFDKPNGRVVYTLAIWADYYLDINVLQTNHSIKCEYDVLLKGGKTYEFSKHAITEIPNR